MVSGVDESFPSSARVDERLLVLTDDDEAAEKDFATFEDVALHKDLLALVLVDKFACSAKATGSTENKQ